MLQVAHGCPACGQVHEGQKFGFKHRAPRECPVVVTGNFPVVTVPNPMTAAQVKVPSVIRAQALQPAPVPEVVSFEPVGTVPTVSGRDGERGRALGLPWLPPPDLGEVL